MSKELALSLLIIIVQVIQVDSFVREVLSTSVRQVKIVIANFISAIFLILVIIDIGFFITTIKWLVSDFLFEFFICLGLLHRHFLI